MNQPHAVTRRGLSLSKKSCWTFSPSCYQNCKINFCSMILQFCRCGGLFNAKGNPDGFLSHFSFLRNLWLGSFFQQSAAHVVIRRGLFFSHGVCYNR